MPGRVNFCCFTGRKYFYTQHMLERNPSRVRRPMAHAAAPISRQSVYRGAAEPEEKAIPIHLPKIPLHLVYYLL